MSVHGALAQVEISSLSEITDPAGNYIITNNINASGNTSIANFSGTLTAQANDDGTFPVISGLSAPLFTTATGAVISNIMLSDVSVSGESEYIGAIACVADGYTRIYNCGILPADATFPDGTHPSVSTSGNCAGSLVGNLKDDSRVVNCFSYADVSSSGTAAGIVGNNNFASNASVSGGKYTKLRTMVVNCMYYGNISAPTIYPVYGGQKISNKGANAINNYNFYSVGCSFSPALTGYNCSWPAQLDYLTRYEFHRNLLNSNRELCGWWVGAPSAPSTMTTAEVQAVPKDASLIAKWVLDPAVAPYPILKAFGKYASPVNIDADASWRETANEWEGKKLGTLSVTVNGGAQHAASESLELTITDMDTLHVDYCYKKVQLPYYNSVFGNPDGSTWAEKYGGNYGDYVVIGWKISASGGTTGELITNWETGYNFADRNCTAKDADRIFAQGGYYYVPEGVTSITITAQWASAIYLDNSDNSYDRVNMSSSKPGNHFAPAGKRPPTLANGKTVSTNNLKDLANASTGNVFNLAVVLVGNHQYRHDGEDIGSASGGFTVMSSDFDFDEEPDHCLIWQLGTKTTRQSICPIRFDFLPVEEMGLAMKEDGSTQYYSLGCYRPLGHFEVTETSLIRFGQFEFSNGKRQIYAPLILNGGIYDQYTKGTKDNAFSTADDKIDYIIIGGNVRMPSFTPGAHVNPNANFPTRHCAVNVIGGSIDFLYLTGNYNEGVKPNADNPHCYIDGGRIMQVAAAGKEGINGDVYFKINHSKIWQFYGGSTMDLSTGNNFKTVKGNINVDIDNSIVNKYCGGPKFGDMVYDESNPANSKTVTTNANNTIFGVYYGGGNGGTSYVQYDKTDGTYNANSYDWNTTGKLNNYTAGKYRDRATGYQADYDMEIINVSTGTLSGQAVYRTYFYSAQFSATNTGPITNNLTNCTVLTNFYGGGNLGGVKGSVTSSLTGTQVYGSAFGGGFSATIPDVIIHNKDKDVPTIDINTGIVTPQSSGTSTTYTWTNETSLGGRTLSTDSPAALNVDGKNYYYTEIPLVNLGTVTGTVTLNINDGTTVADNVFGGGEMSGVGGSVVVNMNGGNVSNGVYGGGALANTNTNSSAGTEATTTTVNLVGGTVNNVYGGGLGQREGFYDATDNVEAYVYGDVAVLLNGSNASGASNNCKVTGNIFGCNNLNGTPKGSVLVHVYKTVGYDGEHTKSAAKDNTTYDVAAVYGGGNLSAYQPTSANAFSEVIIEGCDWTSIGYVYGGGNAASSPGTKVTVSSAYEIGSVFGGGNGKDDLPNGDSNPGAHVGYLVGEGDELTEYGTGRTLVELFGGTIHYAFGGSNTKGNIWQGATVRLDESGSCPLTIDEVYGAGNNADQDGAAQIQLGCVSYLKEIYGGARDANLGGSIELTITSGRFDRIFGGNNLDGHIDGTIVVNIEETGCHPIIIGQLYGGGNLAPYNAPAGEAGPTLNVRSFTSIGDIYGGGYGAKAVVTGDVYINIEESVGVNASSEIDETAAHTDTDIDIVVGEDGTGNPITETVFLPGHTEGTIGAINNVYGGGNEAAVKGNTHINIGTKIGSDIIYVSPAAATEAERTKTVTGADIRNNVFGGGNKADVTGNTNVLVGKKTE